jgi:hypothetical protein
MNLYHPEGRVKRRPILLGGMAVAAVAALGVMLWNRTPTCHLSGPSQSPAQRISGYGMSGIVAPDGTLWVWGEDTWGMIRTNGGFHSRPRKLGPIEDWRQVASSGGGYVGLRRDGSVWGWRGPRTLHGQVSLPVGAPETLVPGTNWVQVVGGMHRFFLLRADGSLFAAGDNSEGQLGDGTTIDRDQFVRVASERRWRQLAVTPDVTTAIDDEEGLWQWGRLIGPKPVARGIPNRWSEITSAGPIGVARTVSGRFAVWGINFTEQPEGFAAPPNAPQSLIEDTAHWSQVLTTDTALLAYDTQDDSWHWIYGFPDSIRFPFDNTPRPRLPVPRGIRPLWMENSGERFYGWSDDGQLWVRGQPLSDGSGILNGYRWKRQLAEWLQRHQIDSAVLRRWSGKDHRYNTNFVAVARFVSP